MRFSGRLLVRQALRHKIRYDLRGHGRSAAPLEPYTGYDDLRGILDELGIKQATLVGVSAGSELSIAGFLQREIPGASLVTVPGAGHIVNLDDTPGAFNEAVAAFVARR